MVKHARLKFNDPAPDLQLLNMSGSPVRLSSFWKRNTLLLAFTRHFGCPQCKEMIEVLARASKHLRQAGLDLAFISQGAPKQTQAFFHERVPGWVVLSDPGRIAYAAYSLGRANFWQTFLSPRVWLSNLHLRRVRGWRTELPPEGQDAMQLEGIFVIGMDGRIRLPYYYNDIADHPPLELLLHGVMGVNWNQPFETPVAPLHKKSKRKTARRK